MRKPREWTEEEKLQLEINQPDPVDPKYYAAAYHARNGLLAALSALDKRSPAYRDCLAGLAALKEAWGDADEWPAPVEVAP